MRHRFKNKSGGKKKEKENGMVALFWGSNPKIESHFFLMISIASIKFHVVP